MLCYLLLIKRGDNPACAIRVLGVVPKTKLNSVVLVRERTIPTEGPPLVGEVSANFCG
jgi:hypothetical protein